MRNKLAMGRYWRASNVGVWLEEDKMSWQGSKGGSRAIDFYGDSPVAGLLIAGDKVVRATLQNHYGKSCTGRRVGRHPSELVKPAGKFCIRLGGIADA